VQTTLQTEKDLLNSKNDFFAVWKSSALLEEGKQSRGGEATCMGSEANKKKQKKKREKEKKDKTEAQWEGEACFEVGHEFRERVVHEMQRAARCVGEGERLAHGPTPQQLSGVLLNCGHGSHVALLRSFFWCFLNKREAPYMIISLTPNLKS
jgi:hypothetical protein